MHMALQHERTAVIALAFAAALGLQAACGGGERNTAGPAAGAGEENQAAAARDESVPAGVRPDPAAERQVITLTGCLQRGISPAEFTLVSVATAGITEPAQPRRQQGAAAPNPTPESAADVRAASSYRLMSLGDEDLSEYVGQRVTVSGRLAAESAQSAPAGDEEHGRQVAADSTSSTVAATAPPLRGFYVASVRKVDDSCAAESR
jgi:hypothetical protein